MTKTFVAALAVAALSLAACQSAQNGGGQTVTVSQAQVASAVQELLVGAENAVTVYMSAGTVSDADKAKIAAAEKSADALVGSLPTVAPANFAQAVKDAEDAVNGVIVTLPPELVTPQIKAGVAAVEIMIDTIVPLLPTSSSAAPAMVKLTR